MIWTYLVSLATRSLGWSGVVAVATGLLYWPRLPGDVGLAFLGLPAVLLPVWRRWDVVSPATAGYLVGHCLGLAWGQKWLLSIIHRYGGFSQLKSSAVFLTMALIIAIIHALLAYTIGVFRRSLSPTMACLFGASLFTLCEAALAFNYPWYEAVSVGFALAGAPGAVFLIRLAGPSLLSFVAVSLVLAVLLRSGKALAAVTALLLVSRFAVPLAEASSGAILIHGMQLKLNIQSPDWQKEHVAAYLEAENDLTGDIVVWPEGAYPFTERLFRNQRLLNLDRPRGYDRLLGMHIATGVFQTLNAVVVQHEGGAISYRSKSRLAPLYETRRIVADKQQGEPVLVRGYPVLLPICYEILDRSQLSGKPFLLGITISSDIFDPSGTAAKILTRAAWLRAMECGVPFVRISDAAYSAAFGSDGGILKILEPGAEVMHQKIDIGSVPKRCGQAQKLILMALALMTFTVLGWLTYKFLKAKVLVSTSNQIGEKLGY